MEGLKAPDAEKLTCHIVDLLTTSCWAIWVDTWMDDAGSCREDAAPYWSGNSRILLREDFANSMNPSSVYGKPWPIYGFLDDAHKAKVDSGAGLWASVERIRDRASFKSSRRGPDLSSGCCLNMLAECF